MNQSRFSLPPPLQREFSRLARLQGHHNWELAATRNQQGQARTLCTIDGSQVGLWEHAPRPITPQGHPRLCTVLQAHRWRRRWALELEPLTRDERWGLEAAKAELGSAPYEPAQVARFGESLCEALAQACASDDNALQFEFFPENLRLGAGGVARYVALPLPLAKEGPVSSESPRRLSLGSLGRVIRLLQGLLGAGAAAQGAAKTVELSSQRHQLVVLLAGYSELSHGPDSYERLAEGLRAFADAAEPQWEAPSSSLRWEGSTPLCTTGAYLTTERYETSADGALVPLLSQGNPQGATLDLPEHGPLEPDSQTQASLILPPPDAEAQADAAPQPAAEPASPALMHAQIPLNRDSPAVAPSELTRQSSSGNGTFPMPLIRKRGDAPQASQHWTFLAGCACMSALGIWAFVAWTWFAGKSLF